MMHISDNHSQEGCGTKGNKEVFALPLVGRRRKASEAGYTSKPNNLSTNKRQHKKETVAAGPDASAILELKKTKSAAFSGIQPQQMQQPFSTLFQTPATGQ